MSRRLLALVALLPSALSVSLAAVSCGSSTAGSVAASSSGSGGASTSSTSSASVGSGGGDAGADVLMPPDIDRTETEAQLAPKRAACGFAAGAWPGDTIGTDYPIGADIPINHVIVIIQENRSFDHYLGRLVAQGYYKAGDFTTSPDGGLGSGFAASDELDGPPAGWSNPDGDGGTVVPHPDDEHCFTANHSWAAEHDNYDDGGLDHFVTQNAPDGQKTFFYEDDTVIPFYYALASTFGVGDRYFCSVMTSTWPNRYFAMAATSYGIGDNSFCTVDMPNQPAPQIFSLLQAGAHSWKDYTDGPHMVQFYPYFGFSSAALPNLDNIACGLLGDIENGTLPDVSFVMGDEISESSDEGPSDLPGIGGQVVETIVRKLFASPSWKDTAVFITYDENGGMADHVSPAPACAPDGYAPHDGQGNPLPAPGFDRTGFRVPFIVVSPYAKAHFASHVVHDHSSILRFIEARFGLPALTARDANATPPMEMFDFKNPPFMTPPSISATTTVPPAILTQCNQSLAPLSCAAFESGDAG